jgi:hypothetical protein
MLKPSLYEQLVDEEGHLNEEGIALYAEALHLDRLAELPEFLLHHVEDCISCKSQSFEIYQVLRSMEEEFPSQDHPFFREQNTENQREQAGTKSRNNGPSSFLDHYRIAAGISIIIALGLSLYFLFKPSKPPLIADFSTHQPDRKGLSNQLSTRTVEKDSLKINNLKPKKTELVLKESYEANQGLEKKQKSIINTGSFNILSPVKSVTINAGKDIQFSWDSKIRTQLGLRIFDNRNHPVYSGLVSGHAFLLKNNLKPGLYYWFIYDGQEILAGNTLVITQP